MSEHGPRNSLDNDPWINVALGVAAAALVYWVSPYGETTDNRPETVASAGLVPADVACTSECNTPTELPSAQNSAEPELTTPVPSPEVVITPEQELTTPVPTPETVITPEPSLDPLPDTVPKVAEFIVGNMNVLGTSHTSDDGKYDDGEYESGVKRMNYTFEFIQREKIDVGGFTEIQQPQREKFMALAKDNYGLYFVPGKSGDNAVFWDTRVWEKKAVSFYSSPYFNGNEKKMPIITLKHLETQQLINFSAYHHPADTYRFKNQEKYRDQATDEQIQQMNELIKQGHPVVFMGDANEREEYRDKVNAAGFHSSVDGTKWANDVSVDQIAGKGVIFADHEYIHDRLTVKATDHRYYVVTKAVVSE